MADITAAQIRKVREITGAGMTDVKKALVEADGDERGCHRRAPQEGRRQGGQARRRPSRQQWPRRCRRGRDHRARLRDRLRRQERAVHRSGQRHRRPRQRLEGSRPRVPAGRDAGRRPQTVEQSIDATPPLRWGRRSSSVRYAYVAGTTVATYLHKKATDLPPQIGVVVAFHGEGRRRPPRSLARPAMQVSAVRSTQYLAREDVPAEDGRARARHRRGDRQKGRQARGAIAISKDRRGFFKASYSSRSRSSGPQPTSCCWRQGSVTCRSTRKKSGR